MTRWCCTTNAKYHIAHIFYSYHYNSLNFHSNLFRKHQGWQYRSSWLIAIAAPTLFRKSSWYEICIFRWIDVPEIRSSGRNTSSIPQVSTLIPRSVSNRINRRCQRQVIRCHGINSLALNTCKLHCGDVIMGPMASQITSLMIVYSTVYSGR